MGSGLRGLLMISSSLLPGLAVVEVWVGKVVGTQKLLLAILGPVGSRLFFNTVIILYLGRYGKPQKEDITKPFCLLRETKGTACDSRQKYVLEGVGIAPARA